MICNKVCKHYKAIRFSSKAISIIIIHNTSEILELQQSVREDCDLPHLLSKAEARS